MSYPHDFKFLRDAQRPAVFLCGAGFSRDLIPLSKDILADNRATAEAEISSITGVPFPALRVPAANSDALYIWAEQARDELARAKHPCPKLQIAQSLGLTTDARWLAGVGLPVSVAKPRHRVLARFAREQCWNSIWTFNWDCHIEAALESIGIKEEKCVAEQPWPMRYQRVLSLKDYGTLPKERTVFVHKRHGCISKLKELEQLDAAKSANAKDYNSLQFKITKDELDAIDKADPDYQKFESQISVEFSGYPLMACGWSASENYLLDEFEKCSVGLRKFPDCVGRLSSVDPQFNPNGHLRLATIYDVTEAQSHFPVEPAIGHVSQDTLFLWLQDLHALCAIDRVLSENKGLQTELRAIGAKEHDPANARLLQWADWFLPAWVQLCWRAGLVTASYKGKKLKPNELALQGDEWYVPLMQNVVERPEIVAAAQLLKQIDSNPRPWRYDFVAGALFDDHDAHLFLPVPAWTDAVDSNMLNSLPRLVKKVDAVRGYINKMSILAMTQDGTRTTVAVKQLVKDAFVSVSKRASDATAAVIDIEDL